MTTQHLTASDLMKGDWVQVIDAATGAPFVCRIMSINTDRIGLAGEIDTCSLPIGCIEPVLITPEILEKNGFYLSQRDKYHAFLREKTFEIELKKSTNTGKVLGIKYIGNMGYTRKSYNLPLPSFVHELQHALKLCGINKEIIL